MQQLVECATAPKYGDLRCAGGGFNGTFQYMIDNGGVDSLSDYPYTAGDGWGGGKCWTARSVGAGSARPLISVYHICGRLTRLSIHFTLRHKHDVRACARMGTHGAHTHGASSPCPPTLP